MFPPLRALIQSFRLSLLVSKATLPARWIQSTAVRSCQTVLGMARAGGRGAGKVLSSGRLSLPVRPATCKKRSILRKSSAASVDSGYSLCSTDSEDQVLDINHGLDRCAALLHEILQCDVKDNQMKPHRLPGTKGVIRPPTVKTKKTVGRKPTTASHVYKEKGPLRRTFPPGPCSAVVQRPHVSSPSLTSQKLDHVTTQMERLQHAFPPVTGSTSPATGPETSALYNCRLPTSTPTLSPQHPAIPQSSSHQTPPPGCSTRSPPSSSGFQVEGNAQPPALHNSALPTACKPTNQANIFSQLQSYKSLIRDSDLLQCVAAHLTRLHQGDGPLQDQAAESAPPTESDETLVDEDDANAALVREISCQTSFNKKSPEKKMKTVKYLLEEIKSLVADQGDVAVMRLVMELEHRVSLLPVMEGSTNVHAEIALALQPLRSENAQLRRRLRILNQQLRESGTRTEEQNSEVTSLQSLNEILQHELRESQRALDSLRSKNQELLQVIEALEEGSRTAARSIQDKEQEIRQIQQQNDITSINIRKEVDEAVGKMKSVQIKLEASEKEKQILEITLRQRDAEITRLRELARTLQASMAKLLCDLGKDSPILKPGISLTQATLGSYDRQVQSEQCPASTSIMKYLKTLETEQVFTGAESDYSNPLQIPPSSQVSCRKGVDSEPSDDYVSRRDPYPPELPQSSHTPKPHLGSESCNVTSDETLYLPLASRPTDAKSNAPLRRMCTPPQVYRDCDNGLHTTLISDLTSKVHQQDSKLEALRMPSPPLQHLRGLPDRDLPPTEFSQFEGKPDWTICSFSTFTSHDEQEFRNGLAALDANIAKLQRTLQNSGPRK